LPLKGEPELNVAVSVAVPLYTPLPEMPEIDDRDGLGDGDGDGDGLGAGLHLPALSAS
jgi:hypothetical protein